MLIKSYEYGARVKHILKVEVDDSPADPTTLRVYFSSPAHTQTGPFTPTKDAQGLYQYQKTYTATSTAIASTMWGDWAIKWVGTGVAEGTVIRRFYINSSNFNV